MTLATDERAALQSRALPISVSHVTVSFDLNGRSFDALKDVSVELAAGETLAIVGPSGCGKSTLLNLIAGFLFPTRGSVKVDGVPVAGPGRERAVVFQPDAVFPWMTVRRNLEYGPRMQKRLDQEARQRVDQYLEILGLTNFEHALPKMLSGGMRKRVDVGRAYVNRPGVMLLDEPFGALDDMTKAVLQEELVRLSAAEPMTTLFITHDIEEAIFVADRVAVMSDRPGRIEEILTPPAARDRTPEFRTTAEFQSLRRHIQGLLRGTHEEGQR